MEYPYSIKAGKGTLNIDRFLGINRRKKAGANEFFNMENMTNFDYPCFSSATLPESIVSKEHIIKFFPPQYNTGAVTSFSGVTKPDETIDNYSLYVNGSVKRDDITEFLDIVDFNGCFITIPQLKGVNYLTNSSDNEIDVVSTTTEVRIASDSTEGYNRLNITHGKKQLFKAGDLIMLSGFTGSEQRNNTYFPVNSMDLTSGNPVSITVLTSTQTYISGGSYEEKLTLSCKKADGNDMYLSPGTYENITITMAYPQCSCACVYGNRLFACDKTGERIYASRLAQPLDFYTYGVLSTDAWYGDVGTPGKFNGIVAFKNCVLALKSDYVHIIYGNTPKSYNIDKTYRIGCIDKNSVAVLGNQVIWLYYDGFYSFTGGIPKRISDSLNTKYVSATAFSDNRRYYVRAEKADGSFEFLVFDGDYNLWTKLSDTPINSGYYIDGTQYIATDNKVLKLYGSEYGDFFFISNPITFDSFKTKSMTYMNIRADLGADSFFNVYTKVNGGDWVAHKGVLKSGAMRVPLRYSPGDTLYFKIEGYGKITIYDIEINALSEYN